MTCKDCVHEKVCKVVDAVGSNLDNAEVVCGYFKNKADFVEVEKVAEMFAEQIGDFPCNVNDNAEWLCVDCDCKCSMKCWEQFVRQYGERKR